MTPHSTERPNIWVQATPDYTSVLSLRQRPAATEKL